MFSMLRLIVLAFAGLIMAGYGLFHSVHGYPGALVFQWLGAAVPTLLTVMSFALGILSAIAGSVMLALALYRFRRRQSHALVDPRDPHGHGGSWPPAAFSSRPSPAYRDDSDLDPDGNGGYAFDDEHETPDFRVRAGDNGRVDRRRWAANDR